jgi:hypothetical protein
MSDSMAHQIKWKQHAVPELGISLDFLEDRPIQTALLEGTSYVFQNMPEVDGSLFLRYGAKEKIEVLVPRLGDALTKATAVEPRHRAIAGTDAECVDVTLDTPEYELHRETAEGMRKEYHAPLRTYMSVCGFRSPSGIPVLIGYRIPELHMSEWRDILEHFLQSARPLP